MGASLLNELSMSDCPQMESGVCQFRHSGKSLLRLENACELTATNGLITGIPRIFNGLPMAALLSPGAFAGNDSLLLIPPAPLAVTPNGFSFLDSGATQFNIDAVRGTQCTCRPSGCVCVPINLYESVSDNGINNDVGNSTLTLVAGHARTFCDGDVATSRPGFWSVSGEESA